MLCICLSLVTRTFLVTVHRLAFPCLIGVLLCFSLDCCLSCIVSRGFWRSYCREWLNGDHQDFFRGLPRSFRDFCFLLTVCLRGAHDRFLAGSLFFAGSLKQYALFSRILHAILLNWYSFCQQYVLPYIVFARCAPHAVRRLRNHLLNLYGLCQLYMSWHFALVSCTSLCMRRCTFLFIWCSRRRRPGKRIFKHNIIRCC